MALEISTALKKCLEIFEKGVDNWKLMCYTVFTNVNNRNEVKQWKQ